MKLPNTGRYEIKFVLDQVKLAQFEQWMYCLAGAQQSFESRYVNSLYFEDVSYQSARDNLAGVADRKKMRLRWYHDLDRSVISSLALELKIRTGRLGQKKSFPLPELQDRILDLELGSIMELVQEEISDDQDLAGVFDDYYVPVVRTEYHREYFENIDSLRITLDRDIKFHHVAPHEKMFDEISAPYPMTVAELKFSPELKPSVVELLRYLPMTPKRHSKYLVGLSIFRQAIYL